MSFGRFPTFTALAMRILWLFACILLFSTICSANSVDMDSYVSLVHPMEAMEQNRHEDRQKLATFEARLLAIENFLSSQAPVSDADSLQSVITPAASRTLQQTSSPASVVLALAADNSSVTMGANNDAIFYRSSVATFGIKNNLIVSGSVTAQSFVGDGTNLGLSMNPSVLSLNASIASLNQLLLGTTRSGLLIVVFVFLWEHIEQISRNASLVVGEGTGYSRQLRPTACVLLLFLCLAFSLSLSLPLPPLLLLRAWPVHDEWLQRAQFLRYIQHLHHHCALRGND